MWPSVERAACVHQYLKGPAAECYVVFWRQRPRPGRLPCLVQQRPCCHRAPGETSPPGAPLRVCSVEPPGRCQPSRQGSRPGPCPASHNRRARFVFHGGGTHWGRGAGRSKGVLAVKHIASASFSMFFRGGCFGHGRGVAACHWLRSTKGPAVWDSVWKYPSSAFLTAKVTYNRAWGLDATWNVLYSCLVSMRRSVIPTTRTAVKSRGGNKKPSDVETSDDGVFKKPSPPPLPLLAGTAQHDVPHVPGHVHPRTQHHEFPRNDASQLVNRRMSHAVQHHKNRTTRKERRILTGTHKKHTMYAM